MKETLKRYFRIISVYKTKAYYVQRDIKIKIENFSRELQTIKDDLLSLKKNKIEIL